MAFLKLKTDLPKSISAAFALLSIIALSSAEVTFTTDQSEYYFLVGENALIDLHSNNSGERPASGMMSYTLSTSMQQSGFSYHSSNTNSRSLTIPVGAQNLTISLGTSETPVEVDLDISFSYTSDNGTQMLVDMPPLKVIFVEEESQKRNVQNAQSSQSKTEEQIRQEQQHAREEAERQREEQIKQQMQQQQIRNQMQNRMQNNQMSQNTQAIKQEIQQKQQAREDFARNLQTKEEFKRMAGQLASQGFNMTSSDISAQDAKNGNFSIEYKNKAGERRTLEGSMKNDTLESIEIRVSKEIRRGEKPEEGSFNWLAVSLFFVALLLAFIMAKRFMPHKDSQIAEKTERPFDHVGASLAILEEAKRLFEQERFKDAYAKASEAVRFYYAHELGLNRELTATELVKELKSRNLEYNKARECLNLCALVEFARYAANREDFDRILRIAKELISKRSRPETVECKP